MGPAVSFVALIAVLRTISLQRDAVNTQRTQFQQLEKIQQNTLLSQLDQLTLAKQSEQADVLAYKTAVLKVAEHQIGYYMDAGQKLEGRLDMLQQAATQSTDANSWIEALKKVAGDRDIAQSRLNGLQAFVLKFMLKKHTTMRYKSTSKTS
ncbi:hypothetical protein GCM10007388_07160 [Pseudoduganella plicata]|uniref:Uncharacterized protein n=1 Tax=Pseudoduganella plicata TaxID=321984 RepID=A0AA87Y0U4_9BURK|nr:hypothetical protein GCM10007388_07160 [Pseudoduganella plicata]